MSLKNLSITELKAERNMIDSALAGAEFRLCVRRDLDDIEEMHARYDIKRYREQLSHINAELESRNV